MISLFVLSLQNILHITKHIETTLPVSCMFACSMGPNKPFLKAVHIANNWLLGLDGFYQHAEACIADKHAHKSVTPK